MNNLKIYSRVYFDHKCIFMDPRDETVKTLHIQQTMGWGLLYLKKETQGKMDALYIFCFSVV